MKYILQMVKTNQKLVAIYLLSGISSALLATVGIDYFQEIINDFSNKKIMPTTMLIYGPSLGDQVYRLLC